jgi:hypothetical protein
MFEYHNAVHMLHRCLEYSISNEAQLPSSKYPLRTSSYIKEAAPKNLRLRQ